jgi:hypothetical protein
MTAALNAFKEIVPPLLDPALADRLKRFTVPPPGAICQMLIAVALERNPIEARDAILKYGSGR